MMDELQKVAQSLAVLEAEVKGMQGATQERIRVWEQRLESLETRIRSLHDSIAQMRQDAVAVGKEAVQIKSVADEVRDDLDKLETKTENEVDKIKKGQAAWIETLGQRAKWVVGTLIALAALALAVW